ncbi:MAG: hypothetical protein JW754_03035 [Candidatus Aenigmarchaeota archaeon]|nr:hypothetical protein [Candidatus Aenigmarchaeota archaeon]
MMSKALKAGLTVYFIKKGLDALTGVGGDVFAQEIAYNGVDSSMVPLISRIAEPLNYDQETRSYKWFDQETGTHYELKELTDGNIKLTTSMPLIGDWLDLFDYTAIDSSSENSRVDGVAELLKKQHIRATGLQIDYVEPQEMTRSEMEEQSKRYSAHVKKQNIKFKNQKRRRF